MALLLFIQLFWFSHNIVFYHDQENAFRYVLLSDEVITTIYHACKEQCNSDPTTPANPKFKIDLERAGEHKIVAFEREFAKKHGLKFGDVVYIEGTDYDGYYQYQDRMNKRFAGQKKIDLLVDKSIKGGKWTNVKVYKVVGDERSIEKLKEKEFLQSL